MPSPAAANASYDKAVANRSGGITGLATPEKQPSHDRAVSPGPPAAAMTSAKAVPMSTSTTQGTATSPTTVQMSMPGDSAVPIERNQSAPRARMNGTLASVSTLLTAVGWGDASSVTNRPCSNGGSRRGSGSCP